MNLSKLKSLPVVYWIAAAAFAARLIGRIAQGIGLFWVNGYTFFFDLAQSVAAGHGIAFPGSPPTAFRVPLYPIFLAGLTFGHKAFWPIAIAQSLIGALTALYAAQLARTMFSGEMGVKAGNWAAAGTAFFPYYIIHDTALEETGLFTVLTLTSVLVLLRSLRTRQITFGASAGLLLGLDVLTRATIAPFAALVPFWLVWRKRMRAAVACAVVLAATIAPWLWRNYLLTGVPVLSTEAGEELWNGNNGFLFRHYPQESSDLSKYDALDALTPQDRNEIDSLSGNEELVNQWFLHRALAYMRQHPLETAWDDCRKIVAGFYFLPSPRRGKFEDLVYALSYSPVMLLGLWGMWRRRACWRTDSLVYLLFGTFTFITALFWAHTSHGSYLDVYWIVFGAGALADASAPTGRSSSWCAPATKGGASTLHDR